MTPPSGNLKPPVPHVRILPVSGGEARALVSGPISGSLRAIAWSADAQYVLFTRGFELWRVPVNGGEPVNTGVTTYPGDMARLSAHPDGRRVAISTIAAGSEDIWAIGGLLKAGR